MNFKNLIVYGNSLVSKIKEWGFSWEGIFNNKNGEWWLFIQLLIIGMHLFPSWPNYLFFHFEKWGFVFKLNGFLIFSLGSYLAIKSLLALGANLSPLPEPKSKGLFISNGMYRYCRHPLYLSLIIMSTGYCLMHASLLHFFLFLSLCTLLISKAHREELSLTIKFSEYKHYMKSKPAIIKGLIFFDWRS